MIAVRKGDLIRLNTRGTNGMTVRLSLNLVDDKGLAYSQSVPVVTTSDRTNASGEVTGLSDGFLYSASVGGVEGSTPVGPGELYVEATIRRSGAGEIVTILQGYFYAGHLPSYPGKLEGPMEGPGRRRTASGANPAAGAEVADTVPTNAAWRLISAEVVLVTDGNAANRNTNFFIDDAGATITRAFIATDSTNQTATLTRTHGWYEGADTPSTASVSLSDTVTVLAKFPTNLPLKYTLNPGSNLRTVTTNIQAGDDYGAARYVVEEWIQLS